MMSKLVICQTKLPTSQYVPRTSEIYVWKWHTSDQSSDVHRTSRDIRRQCQKLTYPGPSLWRPQNLHGMSESNVSNWRSWDIQWTWGIDNSYWPELVQSPDIHRTSIGCQELTSVGHLNWTKVLISIGHHLDDRIQCQILTYPGPSFWHLSNVSMMSELDVSIWHILDNGADVTRLLLGRQF